jgi:hypothetical protein
MMLLLFKEHNPQRFARPSLAMNDEYPVGDAMKLDGIKEERA